MYLLLSVLLDVDEFGEGRLHMAEVAARVSIHAEHDDFGVDGQVVWVAGWQLVGCQVLGAGRWIFGACQGVASGWWVVDGGCCLLDSPRSIEIDSSYPVPEPSRLSPECVMQLFMAESLL